MEKISYTGQIVLSRSQYQLDFVFLNMRLTIMTLTMLHLFYAKTIPKGADYSVLLVVVVMFTVAGDKSCVGVIRFGLIEKWRMWMWCIIYVDIVKTSSMWFSFRFISCSMCFI